MDDFFNAFMSATNEAKALHPNDLEKATKHFLTIIKTEHPFLNMEAVTADV